MVDTAANLNMPESLRQITRGGIWFENDLGCSNSRVFLIKGLDFPKNLYLKVMATSQDSLAREVEVLRWLKGKLPVPEVYYYEVFAGKEYLLISEVEGYDASDSSHQDNLHDVVIILADGLRLIHNLDITDCHLDQRLEVVTQMARENVQLGLVDEDDFQPEHMGLSSAEIYQLVLDNRPENEDLVFTHGDYCLPNIIIQKNKLSGFIDLGRAGVADRYQDLALAYRSIRYNFNVDNWQEYTELFFRQYGLSLVDYEKIQYYITLDELF